MLELSTRTVNGLIPGQIFDVADSTKLTIDGRNFIVISASHKNRSSAMRMFIFLRDEQWSTFMDGPCVMVYESCTIKEAENQHNFLFFKV